MKQDENLKSLPSLPATENDLEQAPEVPGAQALVRGLDVLLAIGGAAEPPRFRDLQQAVGIPKGSLHRLLSALQSRRLVRYDERTRRYSPGSRVFDLARRTLDQSQLIRAAKPELSRIARQLKRAACLFVRDGDEVFVLDFEDPDAAQSRVVRVWPRLLAKDTAAGIALAAHMPGEEAAIDGEETSAAAAQSLARALGYAVHNGGPGNTWVAAAITDNSGYPVGAIACAFDSTPARPEDMHEAGRIITEAARRASGNVDVDQSGVLPSPPQEPPADMHVLDIGRDYMGENPVWSPETGLLFWLDILAPALRWFDPSSQEAGRIILPDLFGGLAVAGDDRLILAGRRGIFSYIRSTGKLTLLIDPESSHPENRFNTAAVDSTGALWAGTMALDNKGGAGALYRVTDTLEAKIMLPKIGMPKNVAWSPDGKELYVTEGKANTLYAFDTDPKTNALGKRRIVMQGSEETGTPNGITVDSEGMIWVAMFGGWTIRRYFPDGRLERVVGLPIPMPTNLAFGGPDLETLYITSTYIRMPAGFSSIAPQAGRLISYKPGVRGLPARRFGSRDAIS